MNVTPRIALFLAATLAVPALAAAQNGEGMVPTQMLLRPDSKNVDTLSQSAVSIQIDNKSAQLTSLSPVRAGNIQIALLIDDGLSRNAGIQLDDLKSFAASLPPDTELLVGYMDNGGVRVEVPFTTDHNLAASRIRVPMGVPDQSASPYFCLSEFVKHWPGADPADEGATKARFVMMLTNGVDPYNGSTSILNQDSPYVKTAQDDAARAGVVVSSIYYQDSGFRGGRGSFSGQSYLQQVADATGGQLYNQGPINPVSLTPFFKEFEHDLAETYVATFNTPLTGGGRDHLVRVKVNSNVPKLKIRHPDEVRPGNREGAAPTVAQVGLPE